MSDVDLKRAIIAGNIDRDPVGKNLNPTARENAINFALSVWRGQMGNGEASKIGIKHVTKEIFN